MLYSLVLFIFVIICLLLIGIILLQTSQTGGMGSIGGGNSYLEGALGGQGADSLQVNQYRIRQLGRHFSFF